MFQKQLVISKFQTSLNFFLNIDNNGFLNASKNCGSVLKNDFVVVPVADEFLSNFQRI